MKPCPACAVALVPADYDGTRLLHYPKCGGHLVRRDRLESIQRAGQKGLEALAAEAVASSAPDSQERRRCPGCRAAMRKDARELLGQKFFLDVCPACRMVWLDGGELAKIQLVHRMSARFQESQEFRRRVQELESSPERLAEFEANLAELPEEDGPFEGGFKEAVGTILRTLVHQTHLPLPDP